MAFDQAASGLLGLWLLALTCAGRRLLSATPMPLRASYQQSDDVGYDQFVVSLRQGHQAAGVTFAGVGRVDADDGQHRMLRGGRQPPMWWRRGTATPSG